VCVYLCGVYARGVWGGGGDACGMMCGVGAMRVCVLYVCVCCVCATKHHNYVLSLQASTVVADWWLSDW